MVTNRRDFLASCAAAVAVSRFGCSRAAASGKVPKLGLIFPTNTRGYEEGEKMYGDHLLYESAQLGLENLTPEGYDSVIQLIPSAAEALAAKNVDAIELLGTSLTFYKGEAFNQTLRETVTKASGLKATTMSNGVIEGLKAVRAKRVAAATAYNDVVNDRLRAFLIEHGFEPVVVTGMGIVDKDKAEKMPQNVVLEFAARVFKSAPGADSMLVSCGGFRTLELIKPLEKRTGVPVISSMPHGLWAGARLVGMSGTAKGYGKLLSSKV